MQSVTAADDVEIGPCEKFYFHLIGLPSCIVIVGVL